MRRYLIILFLFAGFQLKAQPSLKGGLGSFVQNNKIYPGYSIANCIQGVVNIAFKLDKKGNVYYSEVRKGIGTDLDDEALRLIRMSSGRWIVPVDHDTTLAIIAPINFSLSDCFGKSPQQVHVLLRALQNTQEPCRLSARHTGDLELGRLHLGAASEQEHVGLGAKVDKIKDIPICRRASQVAIWSLDVRLYRAALLRPGTRRLLPADGDNRSIPQLHNMTLPKVCRA